MLSNNSVILQCYLGESNFFLLLSFVRRDYHCEHNQESSLNKVLNSPLFCLLLIQCETVNLYEKTTRNQAKCSFIISSFHICKFKTWNPISPLMPSRVNGTNSFLNFFPWLSLLIFYGSENNTCKERAKPDILYLSCMTDVPSPMFHGHNPSFENPGWMFLPAKPPEKRTACLD